LRVDLEDDCSGRPNPFWTLVPRRPSIRSRVLRRLPGRALGFLARRFLLFGAVVWLHWAVEVATPLVSMTTLDTSVPLRKHALKDID
jgi:hypothetical protein